METIIGIIDDVTYKEGKTAKGSNWKRTSYTINGLKFSTFDNKLGAYNKDTKVELQYTKDNNYNTINSIKEVDALVVSNETIVDNSKKNSINNNNELILRQCCLKCAVELMSGTITEINKENKFIVVDEVLIMADKFVEWVKK